MKKNILGTILLGTTMLTAVGLRPIPVQAMPEDDLISYTRKETHEYSRFKLGYWQKDRFVLEGQAGIAGKTMTVNNVTKTLEILSQTDVVIKEIKATNTNDYNTKNYDGYQVTLTADLLSTLVVGDYKLQLRVKDGYEMIVVPIFEEIAFVRGFNDYISTMRQLNGCTIDTKYISFKVVSNKLVLNAHEVNENGANPLKTYTKDGAERVYEGWLNTNYDYSQAHTKNIVVKDGAEKEVYRKDKVTNWNINSQYGLGVKECLALSGYQVRVPLAYNTTNFTPYVEVIDSTSNQLMGSYQLYPK